MSSAWSSARIEYGRSGRVAQNLGEMGVEPGQLKGQYFQVEDTIYRDEQGWYLVAKAVNGADGTGRLYFNFESDGNRIEWM